MIMLVPWLHRSQYTADTIINMQSVLFAREYVELIRNSNDPLQIPRNSIRPPSGRVRLTG